MKKKLTFVGIRILSLLLIAGLSLAAANETLTGRIVASQKDKNGNIQEVALLVWEGDNRGENSKVKSYQIKKNKKGNELLKKNNMMVAVSGKVKFDKKGNYSITVKDYKEVPKPEVKKPAPVSPIEAVPEEGIYEEDIPDDEMTDEPADNYDDGGEE